MARPADPHARDALIAAARAAFVRHGILGARIEDIAHAAGLSKGAFYLHFASKEALFGELVEAVAGKIIDCTERRMAELHPLYQDGRMSARDVARKSRRYRELIDRETRMDVEVLEILWNYRDVIAVLVRGSQGTKFETFIWDMADTESARVASQFALLQKTTTCRPDISAEVFGTVVVGAYLLIGQRLAFAKEKPDFASLARAIHLIIHEGSAPRQDAEAPSRAAPPRLRVVGTRRSQRKS